MEPMKCSAPIQELLGEIPSSVSYQDDKGSIQINAGYPGIWVSGKTGGGPKPYQSGIIAAYIDSEGNPCIGLYGKEAKQDACDLAFSVSKDGTPNVQYRKTDGSIGFLSVEKLAALCESV